MVTGSLIGSWDETLPATATGSKPAQTEAPAGNSLAQIDPLDRRDAPVQTEEPPQITPARAEESAPTETPVQTEIPVQTEELAHIVEARPEEPVQREEPVEIEIPTREDALVQRDQLLLAAQTALSDNRLTLPSHESAYYYYQKALALDPGNPQATTGLALIADRYLVLARKAFEKGEDKKAGRYVQLGLQVKSDHAELLAFNDRLARQERSSGASTRPVNERLRRQERSRNDALRLSTLPQAVGGFFRRLQGRLNFSPTEERGRNEDRP
jgi:tetratricopeptide (TPR) repeat protein